MSRPLYNHPALRRRAQTEPFWPNKHAGLWFDKFFDRWSADFDSVEDQGKKAWIEQMVKGEKGIASELAQASRRMTYLLASKQQQPWVFKAESDFVTGLGKNHPIENGFAWHHTLAVPYLPGSSVKGMTRAFTDIFGEQVLGISEPDKKSLIDRIFGPSPDANDEQEMHAGNLVFLDALPTKPVTLKADVMTPHYGPYYMDETGEVAPADWHSPKPIFFLVVAKGLTLQFGIMPRQLSAQSLADCETAKTLLEQALEWTGAGAKTAVGYGRFFPMGEKPTKLSEKDLERLSFELKTGEKLNELQIEFLRVARKEDWENNRTTLYDSGEAWVARAQASDDVTEKWLLAKLNEFLEKHPK